ncbi:AAA family ATPase [Halomicrococcus sp. SG-WS-1]|uniref:AAA family ATPase n=1 Tax=Halomicrococcus sp. SG-WS-1 TaxID=3439057 RepID=UPI003F79F955
MFVVLCGPPATGKTTLATELHERLRARGYEFERLSSDEFSRRTYGQMYERVADSDADWLVDGTFYRREWQERFRRLEDVHFVRVTADVETCLARNRAREDAISEKGLHVVHAEFAPPREALTIDTDERSLDAALDGLEAAVLSWLDDEN